jgi:hypothetical protein
MSWEARTMMSDDRLLDLWEGQQKVWWSQWEIPKEMNAWRTQQLDQYKCLTVGSPQAIFVPLSYYFVTLRSLLHQSKQNLLHLVTARIYIKFRAQQGRLEQLQTHSFSQRRDGLISTGIVADVKSVLGRFGSVVSHMGDWLSNIPERSKRTGIS